MDKIFNFKNLFFFITLITSFMFIKNDGLIDLYKIKVSESKLISTINELTNELKTLKVENFNLENSKYFIEKFARENYYFVFPNEKIIHF
tara:strand:- start:2767 stop:3036 length:270 start_codon:yes stop_codon:yes gene_type:complete